MALKDITLSAIEDAAPYEGGTGMVVENVRGFEVSVEGSRQRGYVAKALVMWDDESDAHVNTEIELFCATIGEVKSELTEELKALNMTAGQIAKAARKYNFWAGPLSVLKVIMASGKTFTQDQIRKYQNMDANAVQAELEKA